MDEAELLARQILRNSQRAVRSAKETILEVIGKPLDDQLRIEGWNSYTCVDKDEAANCWVGSSTNQTSVEQDRMRPPDRRATISSGTAG